MHEEYKEIAIRKFKKISHKGFKENSIRNLKEFTEKF